MDLRRIMAEAGLNYEAAEVAFKKGDIRNKLDATNTPAEDIDEIIKLVENHFNLGTTRVCDKNWINLKCYFFRKICKRKLIEE